MSMDRAEQKTLQEKNKRIITRLALIVVGMFIFAVGVLPPLYSIFCEITGLNGKIPLEAAVDPDTLNDSEQGEAQVPSASTTREVRILFVAQDNNAIPWEFAPIVKSMKVSPGQRVKTSYFAKNLSSKDWVGQAVPSVSPAEGSRYFKKIECFCFTQQPLAAGEEAEMPLIFYLEKDIPDHINEITLAYTLYPAKRDKNQTASID